MKIDNYDASSIEVIEGLEAVRKRPGMYIGDTGSKGLHHLIKEIIDNAIDEHLAGYASNIIIILENDDSISIEDDGRGIPTDIHQKTKKSTIETVFTILHAGGKFGGKNSGYKMSGGLHGVGASVVNALSAYLKVSVWREAIEYNIEFNNGGKLKSPLKKSRIKSNKIHGTKVIFKPDQQIFHSINFNSNIIYEWLQQLAYLNPKLRITFFDNKSETKNHFYYPQGLKQYVEHLSKSHKAFSPIFYLEAKSPDIILKIALKYTTSSEEEILSFVNNINTEDGGSHENALRSALNKAFNNYIVDNNLQVQNLILDSSDLREGIFGVISVFVVEKFLQFEGQTKTRLSSPEVKKFVENKVYEGFLHFLNQNKSYSSEIIKKAYEIRKLKEAIKKNKELNKKILKSTQRKNFGKLIPAQSTKPYECELFLVEGDSAGGSAKLGRDSKIQAILPLKGKIINTEKANLRNILDNEELTAIIYTIGAGIGSNFNLKKINYGKIIIMTDADTDGAHIQVLLLTFFYRFMKPLIDDGRIFIALPPLYKVKNLLNKKERYAWNEKELDKIKKDFKKYEIQRYKGLGEMNYQQLWETTMDKKARTLVQVKIEDQNLAEKRVEILMGKNVEIRRRWIENNVEFSFDDNFDKKNG